MGRRRGKDGKTGGGTDVVAVAVRRWRDARELDESGAAAQPPRCRTRFKSALPHARANTSSHSRASCPVVPILVPKRLCHPALRKQPTQSARARAKTTQPPSFESGASLPSHQQHHPAPRPSVASAPRAHLASLPDRPTRCRQARSGAAGLLIVCAWGGFCGRERQGALLDR